LVRPEEPRDFLGELRLGLLRYLPRDLPRDLLAACRNDVLEGRALALWTLNASKAVISTIKARLNMKAPRGRAVMISTSLK